MLKDELERLKHKNTRKEQQLLEIRKLKQSTLDANELKEKLPASVIFYFTLYFLIYFLKLTSVFIYRYVIFMYFL